MTDISDLRSNVRDLVETGRYWPFALGFEIARSTTSSYTSVSSVTASQELSEDLQTFVQQVPRVKPDWLNSCEVHIEIFERKLIHSDSDINKDILLAAHFTQYFPLLVADLGWTPLEALEIRSSLATFEEDWNAPGMEIYDEL
jgi:hypothetical protein